MAKYVTNKVKKAVVQCSQKKEAQIDTNAIFNITDDSRGVDYHGERELLGQTLVESLSDEAVRAKVFKDRHGNDVLFFNSADLNTAGRKLYHSLRTRGVAPATIRQWIYRAAMLEGIKIIFERGGNRQWRKELEAF